MNPSVRIVDCMRMMKLSACNRRSCIEPNTFPAFTHNRDFCTDAFYPYRNHGWRAQRARFWQTPHERITQFSPFETDAKGRRPDDDPSGRRSTGYFAFMNATAVSSMRLLKPHSLSYQEDAFTSVPPDTLVSVESNMLECGLWLKSTDTSGSLL